VAAVVRHLAEGRRAAAGTGARRTTAIGWLHTAAIETSRGTKTPILVFGDTDLVKEALDGPGGRRDRWLTAGIPP
jgi:hypothetical protein